MPDRYHPDGPFLVPDWVDAAVAALANTASLSASEFLGAWRPAGVPRGPASKRKNLTRARRHLGPNVPSLVNY